MTRSLRIWRTATRTCPACGYTLDAHAAAVGDDDVGPRPGDLSLCTKCITVLMFDRQLRIKIVNAAEMASLTDGERKAVGDAIARLRRARGATASNG